MTDEIESIETYRGVDIDDCQSPDRIAAIVRPAVDAVYAMSGADELLQYCRDITRPPEARRFAAAKAEAMFELAAADRIERPNIKIELVRAAVTGLGSRRWRSPRGYGSLLDPGHAPGHPGHDLRPPEYQAMVEEDGRRRRVEERSETVAVVHPTAGGGLASDVD